ncbi:MAG: hypothetical protein V3U37_02170 [Nitrospinaceae bacterium]
MGYRTVDQEEGQRPFFEYKGNYRDQVNERKQKFKDAFGYDLVDMDRDWSPQEIDSLHKAFEELPPTFYRLAGLKSLYRLNHVMDQAPGVPADEVPAATLPTFMTLFDRKEGAYKVYLGNTELRVEFFNPLFYEDPGDLINIVQHEMAHAFDVANRFLSFSPEWIGMTKFRPLHLFALDGKSGDDHLFTMLNDPAVENYAPPATRHLPTYSRQNLQEDFANSVAAYIHYPYFRYTHPERYRFLKDKTFGGKEYFPAGPAGSYREIVTGDWERALKNGDWERVRTIVREMSRLYDPETESQLFRKLKKTVDTDPTSEKDKNLGIASCFFNDPDALKLRKDLIIQKRVTLKTFFKDLRCRKMSRQSFEEILGFWSPTSIYFFRNGGKDYLQFLDPVLGTAYARGFHTRYNWKVLVKGAKKPRAQGSVSLPKGGNGSVKIDLGKTSDATYAGLPEGEVLVVELSAHRSHPRTFKFFDSQAARIRFILHPWQNYLGPNLPKIRVVYPLNRHFQDFN